MMAEDNNETKKPAAKKAKSEDATGEAKPKKTAAKKANGEAKPKKAAAEKVEAPAAEAKPAAKKETKTEKKTEKAAKPAKKEKTAEVTRLRLQDLKPNKGAKRAKKRVGRGRASGMGKTSTRGHNGEGQRAGRSSKRGFEGGQMPLYRRIPKINGFELINTKSWFEVSTKQLEKLAITHKATDLTLAWFVENGFYNPKRQYGVRLYGNVAVKTAIKVEVHYSTPAAAEALKAAGGSVSLMPTEATPSQAAS